MVMFLSEWASSTLRGRPAVRLLAPRAVLPAGRLLASFTLLLCVSATAFSQSHYEDRLISGVTVTFEGTDRNIAANEQFRTLARETLGARYSAVRIREAIAQLYQTRQIASISVEATPAGENSVNLRFIIKRKVQAQRVSVEVINGEEDNVTEQELLLRLNILQPGTAITEQTLQGNANIILEYLRDRGYY